MNQRSFWCFILGFSNVQLPVLECNPYFIFFQFIGFFFFSISVSCNLIGLFLCLTVGLIQQLQALKCSQQTTEKKTDKKYHGSIVNGLHQGKKSVQETEGASIWQFPKTNLSSGDEQRYQEHKQGSIPRWDKWAHFFFARGLLRSDNSQRQTWVQETNRGIRNISWIWFHFHTSEHSFFWSRSQVLKVPQDPTFFQYRKSERRFVTSGRPR